MYQQIREKSIVFWQQSSSDNAIIISYSEGCIVLLQGSDVVTVKLENLKSFIDAVNFCADQKDK